MNQQISEKEQLIRSVKFKILNWMEYAADGMIEGHLHEAELCIVRAKALYEDVLNNSEKDEFKKEMTTDRMLSWMWQEGINAGWIHDKDGRHIVRDMVNEAKKNMVIKWYPKPKEEDEMISVSEWGGYTCPYCSEIQNGRNELEIHMAVHRKEGQELPKVIEK